MRVSLAQMDISSEKEKNVEKALSFIERSEEIGCDVCVLPELFATGLDVSKAERIDGYTVEKIRKSAKKGVIFSFIETEGENLYNTAVIIDEGKVIGRYRKVHLFKPIDEELYFNAGCEPLIFDLKGYRSSIVICYDIRFPEFITTLSLKGVLTTSSWDLENLRFSKTLIIFVVANFPKPRLDHWITLLKARAIENQIFVVACNRVGKDEKNEFFGHSLVVNPSGEIITEAGEEEELLIVDIDLEEVKEARKACFYLEDRRRECYDRP
ncbi:MAG: C-N hydrolase family amidase [Candidatus Methanolliviera sp. GoM_oil]|nr:MAG: C-N hydrolase family amidase [Candidatus Methanolliviera sp. GoM_oil]